MEEVWSLFFNKDYNLLQKNICNSNDLFVNPIDIGDNNIPNGNSIYLLICSKLNNITVTFIFILNIFFFKNFLWAKNPLLFKKKNFI